MTVLLVGNYEVVVRAEFTKGGIARTWPVCFEDVDVAVVTYDWSLECS